MPRNRRRNEKRSVAWFFLWRIIAWNGGGGGTLASFGGKHWHGVSRSKGVWVGGGGGRERSLVTSQLPLWRDMAAGRSHDQHPSFLPSSVPLPRTALACSLSEWLDLCELLGETVQGV
ncbi:UNVERIFIED_CONTAM: hypothetical protein K2H54_042583 [Gekko kuhli]